MTAFILIVVIAGVLTAYGLRLILSSSLHLPTARARRAIAFLTGHMEPLSDAILRPLTGRLEKMVRLNPYKRRHLAKQLDFAEADMTPEHYIAYAYAQGLLTLPLPILCFLMAANGGGLYFIFMGVLSVLLVWQLVRRALRRVNRWTIRRHNTLEMEWPNLAAYIRQNLTEDASPDIRRLFAEYRQTASEPMQAEIDVLLADLTIGEPDIALERFSTRADSENATALMRAVIAIEKGEDMRAYLDGLDRQLRDWQVVALREEAERRPEECQPALIFLLIAMIALYAAVGGTQIVNGLRGFGML